MPHYLDEPFARVAILFARTDSVYKTLPRCDVWDKDRNATLWPGGCPVIAHPPCRAWGRLRTFARPEPGEPELALWAVAQVRTWGGVLEHPAGSRLWPAAALPACGRHDAWGGFTLWVSQWWFGHRADKPTWLYIQGIDPTELPPLPFRMGEATHVVQSRKRQHSRPHVSKVEREATPLALARWLLTLCQKIVTSPV